MTSSGPIHTRRYLPYRSGLPKFMSSGVARLLPGLLVTALIAAAAGLMSDVPWLKQHVIGGLTLAILLGMLVGNSFYRKVSTTCESGVNFSKQKTLRLGIILYGLNLTFHDIGRVGLSGVLVDVLVLCSTFGLALALGKYVFRLDAETSVLIGAGSAICGAAAVMATAPVVNARTEQVTVAVSTVVVFGTLALFIYPQAYQWNLEHWLVVMTPHQYGLMAGSTIHEVAQVVAAGNAVGPEAANTAVIAKMVRVMMLAPFLLLLSVWVSSRRRSGSSLAAHRTAQGCPAGIAVPWFAFGFVALAAINSINILPVWLKTAGLRADSFALMMAMAALGVTTELRVLRRAGIRPLLMAALLFAWLMGGGLLINSVIAG